MLTGFYGALEGIRTPDLLIRSQTLYPTELPAHLVCNRLVRCKKYIIRFPFDCQRFFQIFLNFFCRSQFAPFSAVQSPIKRRVPPAVKTKCLALAGGPFLASLGMYPLKRGENSGFHLFFTLFSCLFAEEVLSVSKQL